VERLGKALRYKPKVEGSIPVGVTGIFHLYNPFGRTISLQSTQSLTEMSVGVTTAGV
jgi:hypothetical protein